MYKFAHESLVDTRFDRRYTESRKILREAWMDASGKSHILIPLYDNESSVCGIEYNTEPFFFVKNLQGDNIAITDNTGKVVVRYIYDAWGVCETAFVDETVTNAAVIAQINPFRYRGYYFDTEMGLYYLQSRYYDPEVGRFINADEVCFLGVGKLLLAYNLFCYCENSTIIYHDPTGQYNRENAVKYAKKYWDQSIYNPNYYMYSQDCTNFVSQCLHAGGILMKPEWHSYRGPRIDRSFFDIRRYLHPKYQYRWDITPTWRLVKDHYNYFSDPKHPYIYGSIIVISHVTWASVFNIVRQCKVQKGDLLYFAKKKQSTPYHATIITKIYHDQIYYAGHSDPKWNQKLCDVKSAQKVIIVRIKNGVR